MTGAVSLLGIDNEVGECQPPSGIYSSNSPEWLTDRGTIELVLRVLGGIDLDPCSNGGDMPNIPALVHYTKEDDGLSKAWKGRVYINPPYGQELPHWISHLLDQYTRRNVTQAIMLVPARPDTKWFSSLKYLHRCFIHGRMNFSMLSEGRVVVGRAPFPSMAVFLGEDPSKFIEVFSEVGDIYKLVIK